MAKTPEGKAIASRNAYKHGAKSADTCAIRHWLKGLRQLTKRFQTSRRAEAPSPCDFPNGAKKEEIMNHYPGDANKPGDSPEVQSEDSSNTRYDLVAIHQAASDGDVDALALLQDLADEGDIEAMVYADHAEDNFDPVIDDDLGGNFDDDEGF